MRKPGRLEKTWPLTTTFMLWKIPPSRPYTRQVMRLCRPDRNVTTCCPWVGISGVTQHVGEARRIEPTLPLPSALQIGHSRAVVCTTTACHHTTPLQQRPLRGYFMFPGCSTPGVVSLRQPSARSVMRCLGSADRSDDLTFATAGGSV